MFPYKKVEFLFAAGVLSARARARARPGPLVKRGGPSGPSDESRLNSDWAVPPAVFRFKNVENR